MKIVFLLLFILVFSYPFAFTLGSISYSMQDLSQEQKTNLQIASESLNNFVLKPNQVFSFNRFFGERNSTKGYKSAGSYIAGGSSSIGGGLCLLASALYGLALKNNLKILERKAHLKTNHSVPAGLDATIWFPEIDLKFQNTYFFPLQIKSNIKNNKLTLYFKGYFPLTKAVIKRKVHNFNSGQLQVQVYKNNNLVSEDIYKKY